MRQSRRPYGGISWREEPSAAAGMFAALPVMRQLHEMLWYLAEALEREDARSLHTDLTDCLFLTQSQIGSTQGDAATRIPPALRRPVHWR